MGRDRPLSILHIAAPAPVGGLETVVQTLAVGHRRRGHRVGVVAVVGPGEQNHPFLGPLFDGGVDVFPLELPPRAYLRERRAVKELCLAFRPDVVHTHGERPDVLDAGTARRLGVPIVTTLHGSSKLGGISRAYEWLQLYALRRFEAVVVVSRPLAVNVRRLGVKPDKTHVLVNCWNGVVPNLDRDAARRRLGLPDRRFVVGWVGRLIPAKGADVFLDALATLGDLPISAAIIGDGFQRAELEARARRLEMGDRISFHGEVARAADIYPAFDLFVLSSRTEGTPNVLFEAMAADVPIVATAVGGVPDVLSDAEGTCVPPEDPAALAAAIRLAVAQPETRRRLSNAARRRLEAEFAPEPWLAAYERVYRGVMRAGQESLQQAGRPE